jgi:hypothetical protein
MLYIDILQQGIEIPHERSSDSKLKTTKDSMIPWFVNRVQENPDILDTLNDPGYKDKNCTLMRLFNSVTYALKVYLHSTLNIFRSPEGLGSECGIFGIALVDRAVLKIDDNSSSKEPLDEGFSIQIGNRSGSDLLMPYPNFSEWGNVKSSGLKSSFGTSVSFQNIY